MNSSSRILSAIALGMPLWVAVAGAPNTLEARNELKLGFVAGTVNVDASRGTVWLIDSENRRYLGLRPPAGATSWSTNEVDDTGPGTPMSLAVSANGARLVVGVAPRVAAGQLIYHPLDGGARRVIDLGSLVPTAMVVTDGGIAVVAGTESSGSVLASVDLESGVIASRVPTWPGGSLALHPSQTRLYAIPPGDVWLAYQRLDLAAGLLLPRAGTTVINPGVSMAAHPDGRRLLTSNGVVYVTSEDLRADLQPQGDWRRGASVLGLPVFDAWHGVAFVPVVVADVSALEMRDSERLIPSRSWPVAAARQWLVLSDQVVAVRDEAGETRLTSYEHPLNGAQGNQPPVPHFTGRTIRSEAGLELELDAGATTDDGPGLTFRWDLNDTDQFPEGWSTNPVTRMPVSDYGSLYVTLAVADAWGIVRTVRQQANVEPGPEALAASDFRFLLPAPATAWWFEGDRGWLHFGSDADTRQFTLNLTNGLVWRDYLTGGYTRRFSRSADGQRLYVVTADDRMNVAGGRSSGEIIEIDPATGVVGRVPLALWPTDGVVLNSRFAIVARKDGLQQSLHSVDVSTGQTLASLNLPDGPDVRLEPLGDGHSAVFATAFGWRVMRVDPATGTFDPNRLEVASGTPGVTPSTRGWVDPTWTSLVGNNGLIFDLPLVEYATWPRGRLSGGTLAGAVWDIPSRRALFSLTDGWVTWTNPESLLAVEQVSLPVNPTALLGVTSTHLFCGMDGGRRVIRVPNPAVRAEGNTAPQVRLEPLTSPPDTRTAVRLDASHTVDDLDPLSSLRFRWDWDSDGMWDTAFAADAQVNHRFPIAGLQRVTVQAHDTLGVLAAASLNIEVTETPDPGEPVDHTTPDFWGATETASAAAFDPVRPHVYLTFPTSRTLIRWNLTTGRVERQWRFDGLPVAAAMSADGARLMVAQSLLGPEGDVVPGKGRVAMFDLAAGVMRREYGTSVRPYQLVSAGDWLVISGVGSGRIEVCAADTGSVGSLLSFWPDAELAAGPTPGVVYATDRQGQAARIELDPGTGQARIAHQRGLYGEPGFLGLTGWYGLPGLPVLITSFSQLLSQSPQEEQDLRLVGSLVVPNVPVRYTLAAAGGGDRVVVSMDDSRLHFFLPSENWRELEPRSPFGLTLAIDLRGRDITTVFWRDQPLGLALARSTFPSRDAQENLPPTVTTLLPTAGVVHRVGQALEIPVAADDPDGTVTNLAYYADANLLGNSLNGLQFVWTPSTVGAVALRVVATDNWGAQATSAPVNVRVSFPPTVSWLSPTAGSKFEAPALIPLAVEAGDADGTVTQVRFLNGTNVLAVLTAPPWSFTATNVLRDYGLVAEAQDNVGLTTRTAPVAIDFTGLAGDDYKRPLLLTGLSASAEFSNREATYQTGEPRPFFNDYPGAGRTVWWRWVAPSNGLAIASTFGSSFDTVLAVYAITNRPTPGSFLLLASNDNFGLQSPASRVKFRALAGADYRILVDAVRLNPGGDIDLSLDLLPEENSLPPNDAYTNRVLIAGTEAVLIANNQDATREANEPSHAGVPPNRSLWWEWRASDVRLVYLDTAGSEVDTTLGVYTATSSVAALRALVNSDDTFAGDPAASVRFVARPGERFAIAVDTWSLAGGDIRLTLRSEPLLFTEPPANDRQAAAQVLVGTTVMASGHTYAATTELGEPSPAGPSVWYRWQAPATGNALLTSLLDQGAVYVFSGETLGGMRLVARTVIMLPGAALQTTPFIALGGHSYWIRVSSTSRQPVFELGLRLLGPLEAVSLALPTRDGATTGLRPLEATAPLTLAILASTDLRAWVTLATNRVEPGGRITLPNRTAPTEYYQAIRLE